MNAMRRDEIGRAIGILRQVEGMIDEARDILQGVADEEQEAFDNLPEGLQASERGERMEAAVDVLLDVVADLSLDVSGMISNLEDL